MTHRQALQDFPDTSQVLLHNKITCFLRGAENDFPLTDAFQFISEHAECNPS
jgi:hypothetical protein